MRVAPGTAYEIDCLDDVLPLFFYATDTPLDWGPGSRLTGALIRTRWKMSPFVNPQTLLKPISWVSCIDFFNFARFCLVAWLIFATGRIYIQVWYPVQAATNYYCTNHRCHSIIYVWDVLWR